MNDATLAKTPSVIAWIAQLLAAAILGMAALAKLTSNPDSVALFTTLGVEPWGRYLVGACETVAVLLLLRPRTAVLGGLLATGLMVGAIGSHLFKLGVQYNGDPSLFGMAVVVLFAGILVVYLRRASLSLPGR